MADGFFFLIELLVFLLSNKTGHMRSLNAFIILLLVTVVSSQAQTRTYGNFKIDNQQLIYQKVFLNDSITEEKLGDYLVSLPFVSDFDRSNGEIKFKIHDFIVDFKKFQFNEVTASTIIQS